MAIDKKLIFWKKQSTFNAPSNPADTTGSVLWYSIVFFKDTGKIWTNGTFYNCTDDWESITNKPSTFTPSEHNHDGLMPLVIGTQAAATESWTGIASSVDALYDGLTINYWLPYSGSGNATLNLTLKGGGTTGAINCYYSGASRLTTHYGAGNIIKLTYRINANVNGTAYTGWWADANYDTSDNYTHRYYGAFKMGSAAVAANNIIGSGADGLMVNVMTTPFKPHEPIYWTGSAYSANQAVTYGNVYESHFSCSISGTGVTSLVMYQPIYLKGTINNGLFTTNSITQTTPTTDDGFYYIFIGYPWNTTNSIGFSFKNWLGVYKNGAFRIFSGYSELTGKLANSVNITVGDSTKSFDGASALAFTLAEIGTAAINQTMYIGTTAVPINRSSGALSLSGVSIDGNAATATTSTQIAKTIGITDANSAYSDGFLKYYAQVTSPFTNQFPTTNNANGILWVSTHPGSYGHQLGFSSNGEIYRRTNTGTAWTSWKTILDSGNSNLSTVDWSAKNLNISGLSTSPKILINKVSNLASGISWYASSYTAWLDYMANSGTSGNGINGNITAPSGILVTGWGKRSFIENNAGFGWTFESGTNSSTTPSVVAEIRSSDGAAKFNGIVTSAGFTRIGSDNTYVLLGGGSHKLISDFTASLVTSTTTNGTSNVVTGNTNTYLNVVQGGASAGSSSQITGTGSVSVSSDAAGKITINGNTDATTLGGYGAAYYEKGVGVGSYYKDVVNISYHNTAKEILIKTKIPFISSSQMPLIHLEGYAYGSNAPIELRIAFYVYNSSFVSVGCTSTCPWDPQIKLCTYIDGGTTYIAVGLIKSIYFPQCTVNYIDVWGGGAGYQSRNYSKGWTVEYNASASPSIIPTDNLVSVPYQPIANSITGNASTATNATNAATATNLSRSIIAGNGLTGGGELNSNRTITLGTPSAITATSTNSVVAESHTHLLQSVTLDLTSGLNADIDGFVSGLTNSPVAGSSVMGTWTTLRISNTYGAGFFARNNQAWFRTREAGTMQSWNEIWHKGNLTNLNQLTNGPGFITSSGSITGNAATATYAENSSKLYSIDTTYKYGGGSPYYGYLSYTGSRWRFQMSPATPAAIEVAYADVSGSTVSAQYLPTKYDGGVKTNPQDYFSNTIGLRVAMTGAAGTWTDTLWINGYSGGDVLSMCALHTSRQGTPKMWISNQNSNATTYGTLYEFITTYNVSSHALPIAGGTLTGALSGTSASFSSYVNANRLYTGYDSGETNSVSCSNWFRSSAQTGWYNSTYGGGIYMTDSTYVRVFASKAFKVDSTANDSILTAGGVMAGGNIYIDNNKTYFQKLTNGSYYTLIKYGNDDVCYISQNVSNVAIRSNNSTTITTNSSTFTIGSALVTSSVNIQASRFNGNLSGDIVKTNPQLSAATENNEITIVNNAGGAITTNSPISGASIRSAINFRWYSTNWQIGNIRSSDTNTQGFGITSGNNVLCFRVTSSTTYAYGNLSVSGSGTFTGGGFNSLRELKNIHEDWKGSAINTINQFKVRDFNYKNQSNINRTLGFIIDEIPSGIAEYVLMGEKKDSVNLYSLHALSFKAHQETKSEIDLLRLRIQELENKLKILENGVR